MSNISQEHPQLNKITHPILSNVVLDKLGVNINYNLKWAEMGADELDMIEIIIELEKICDISIPDDIYIFDIENSPIDLLQNFRNEKLSKLGV